MTDRKQRVKKEARQRWIALDILQVLRVDKNIPEQVKNDEARLDYLLRRLYGID